jgi:hypothetical protein
MGRRALLVCGIASAMLYIGTDVLGANLYDSYSYSGQTISELFAIGAPTRPLVVSLFLTRSVLQIMFGWGVWLSTSRLRSTAAFLIALGVFDMAAPLFFPMHQRSVLAAGAGTLSDTLHIAGAGVDVLLILFIIGFAANVIGKRFRLHSIGTIVFLLAFGTLAGLDGPRVSANLATPWVGVTERISVYSFMLWMAVLGIALGRVPPVSVPGNERR